MLFTLICIKLTTAKKNLTFHYDEILKSAEAEKIFITRKGWAWYSN